VTGPRHTPEKALREHGDVVKRTIITIIRSVAAGCVQCLTSKSRRPCSRQIVSLHRHTYTIKLASGNLISSNCKTGCSAVGPFEPADRIGPHTAQGLCTFLCSRVA